MSEKPKINIDELITLYLDGEATEREQTTLKRMMLRDSSIAEKLSAFQQQQRLLTAMPVEAAPDSLIDDIRAAMERKLILGDSEGHTTAASGSSHLMVRRLLTAAAMLLIPLGLLSAVVFQIMKPAPSGSIDYVSADQRMADAKPQPPLPVDQGTPLAKLPFNGVLVLTTDEYMTVSNQVEKAIFAKGLVNHTMPRRTADVTSFHISASPKMVADLIDSLDDARRRCKTVTLEVEGAADEPVKITDPQNRQIKMLAYEDNVDMFNHLAGRYASANLKGETMLAADKNTPNLTDDGYPKPSIPTLAGSYDQLEKATIELVIHVERNLK